MTTTEHSTIARSTVIGVFTDRSQADRAIDELRRHGFSYDQIGLVRRGAGRFLNNLKSLFTGQETVNANTADDLMKTGMPEHEARYYQGELEADHSIVIVKTVEHPEQALTILRQSGAYDISSRLRTVQPNVPPPTAQPNVPPPTDERGVPPRANNPNMPPGTYKPTAVPETPSER
jgi:hypothetical protein